VSTDNGSMAVWFGHLGDCCADSEAVSSAGQGIRVAHARALEGRKPRLGPGMLHGRIPYSTAGALACHKVAGDV
jgi:hypothetical protein